MIRRGDNINYSNYIPEYLKLLESFKESEYFGKYSVTNHIQKAFLRPNGIGQYYKKYKMKYKENFNVSECIEITKDEHPKICGGVVEHLTKIKLLRQLNRELIELELFKKYINPSCTISNEEIAFLLYGFDIFERVTLHYTDNIMNDKVKIIEKASKLASIAMDLINETFPNIEKVDLHPQGHVFYDGKLAIKGDADLAINNCLIEFKCKKDYKLLSEDAAQLFAYGLHKYIREGESFEKIYVLNPRFNMLQEVVLNK